MRIAGLVVTYHPKSDELYRNIESFVDDVDIVIVWRNSMDSLDYLTRWKDKILFMGTGCNEYMARPLNEVLDWCVEEGFDFLLTMDQDSVWENFHDFVFHLQCQFDDKVAIYAPNVNNKYSRSLLSNIDVETVITSGSLINVNIAKLVGGFKEIYKIYWVDAEFCYRSRTNGYRIIVFPSFNLKHQLGKQTKTIGGFYTSNYSPFVYYLMFRNMYWMYREHGGRAVSIKCIIYTSMYNIRGVVLGETNKLKKLWSIIKGTLEGMFKKYGNRENS